MSRLKELRAYVNGELEKMENPDKRLGAVNHLYGVSLATSGSALSTTCTACHLRRP